MLCQLLRKQPSYIIKPSSISLSWPWRRAAQIFLQVSTCYREYSWLTASIFKIHHSIHTHTKALSRWLHPINDQTQRAYWSWVIRAQHRTLMDNLCSGVPSGLANACSELHCSLRPSLPNPPPFPISFHRCHTCICRFPVDSCSHPVYLSQVFH